MTITDVCQNSIHLYQNSIHCSINLSTRELDVMRLLVEGYSNPEIAALLYLSPNTVKTHIRSTMNKLNVQNRIQIAVFAVRHQLV